MGIFDRFRSKWSLDGVQRPWSKTASIYEHLRQHTDPTSGKLRPEGQRLPDELELEPSKLSWAAGALDGVVGHHAGSSDDSQRVHDIEQCLQALLTTPTPANFRQLYTVATRDALLGVIDQVTDAIRENPRLFPERVHALASLLAREAPQREAVKFGLALLGTLQGSDDDALVLQLGIHDEFTLFAAVTLINQHENADRALFRLAQRVEGWGRIQVVERLSQTEDPEIRGWLLREGFRNSVMDEYLAYTCAMAGQLHTALSAESVDTALLHGAAGLFIALANGGPAQDLADYPHAESAIAAFLHQLESHALDLQLLSALDALSARPEAPAALKQRINALRSTPAARALIDTGLTSQDRVSFWQADQAARQRAIDTFPHHERRVRAGELDISLFALMQSASPVSIDRALAAVTPHLPLAAIATGPADSSGLGPDYTAHRQLDLIVQELARFPGKGGEFLEAALESPVPRNRYMALRALAAWTPPRWPSSLAGALERAVAREPLDEVKRTMQRVAAGGPFDVPDDEDEDDDQDDPDDENSEGAAVTRH